MYGGTEEWDACVPIAQAQAHWQAARHAPQATGKGRKTCSGCKKEGAKSTVSMWKKACAAAWVPSHRCTCKCTCGAAEESKNKRQSVDPRWVHCSCLIFVSRRIILRLVRRDALVCEFVTFRANVRWSCLRRKMCCAPTACGVF